MKLEYLVNCVVLTSLLACSNSARCEDWPQWNGPRRDGTVNIDSTITTIPAEGLKLLWRKPVSFGYAGPIVSDGKTFVLDYQKTAGEIVNNAGKRDELKGSERTLCFDANDGKLLWQDEYKRDYAVSYGGGPRATPCFYDGVLFMLGSEGDLTAINAEDGKRVWKRQFNAEFGAKTPMWGHASSPMVDGDKLICLVGGKNSLVVAFDRKTGKELWRSLPGKATGYCPPIIIESGGVRQLIVWSPTEVSSLNPETGSVYWQQALKPDYGMSILPPIYDGDLLFTAGEGQSLMLRLNDSRPAVAPVWRGQPKQGIYLATSNGIFHEGHLYGADLRSGALMCARGEDGQRLWQTAKPTIGTQRQRGGAHGSAFLIRQIGNDATGNDYFILSETGAMISATLTPDGYRETGRFQAIEPMLKTTGRTVLWTYPAVADQKLYIRNDAEVVCYSLAE
ncbi:MAG: PQQ-binding-like beta-propeller repeat protein [Planctomycetota bacterium]